MSITLFGCARTGTPPREATVVRECALRLDDTLATQVNASPGPYRLYVTFVRAPRGRFRWGAQAWDCDAAAETCVAVVLRWMLLRLCNDGNVRDIEAWK